MSSSACTNCSAEVENRAPSLEFEGFNPETHLMRIRTFPEAVRLGHFSSALEHYITFWTKRGKKWPPSFELTAQTSDLLIGTTRMISSLAELRISLYLIG